MLKKDVLELKKRFTKNGCTFTKMAGCYIDADKNKVVNLHETFLNLDEEEFYKYLDIAKKTLSGTIHNNLLELEFPKEEEEAGGKQQFLMGLRESKLKNPELFDRFFDLVIENYNYSGNYLILLFHDAYDVIKKTSDNLNLDESEEVYEYIICAICPVTLSKAALGYREDQKRIGSRIRDWVVGVPDTGFIFPAFTERSTDIHSVMFYTKDTKEPHTELMEDLLGCPAKRTATMQKNAFNNLVQHVIDEHAEAKESALMDIQDELHQMITEHEDDASEEELILDNRTLQTVMADSGIPAPIAQVIEEAYQSEFAKQPPVVDSLIDKKIIAENEKRHQQKAITDQVLALQTVIEEKEAAIEEKDTVIKQQSQELSIVSSPELSHQSAIDVVVKVKADRVSQVTKKVVDGTPCLVIPVEDNFHVKINGVDKEISEFFSEGEVTVHSQA